MMKKVLFILFILVATGCYEEVPNDNITYVNNSKYDVVFNHSNNVSLSLPPDYKKIAGQSEEFYFLTTTYGNYFKKYTNDTLYMFIISSDTMAKYTWEEIRDNSNYLQRYDLSFQNLEDLDWHVYYPPNDSMKYVKMHPSYNK